MQKHFICESCDGEFKIKHTMDETYYEVNFCPFCGAEINEEEEGNEDEYDE